MGRIVPLIVGFLVIACSSTSVPARPNIVFLFADDLGYGDLGYTGHPTITTPNIDRLSVQGMRLTQWYSGAPVCTPSRAAMMTGRLPVRTGTYGNYTASPTEVFNHTVTVYDCNAEYGLPLNETTIADYLRTGGYATGLVGKWHLGQRPQYLPNARGFDYYYGIPYSVDMGSIPGANCSEPSCTPLPLLETNPEGEVDIVEQPVNLYKLSPKYAEKAASFIANHTSDPFFLMMSFSHVHTGNPDDLQYADAQFNGTSKRGPFGDAVSEMDWVCGEILSSLDQYGVANNTLVIFTSDNGPWRVRETFSGFQGPFTGAYAYTAYNYSDTGKGTTWEGGVRMPAIVRWPGVVEPFTVSTEVVSTMDVFVTALELAGVPLPTDRVIDGQSLLPILTQTGGSQHPFLFLYRGAYLMAVRTGPYKVHLMTACGICNIPTQYHDPWLVFNVEVDPAETYPLANMTSLLTGVAEAIAEHRANLVVAPDTLTQFNPEYGICCNEGVECWCSAPPQRRIDASMHLSEPYGMSITEV